jgi:hypothetical protein
MLYPFELRARFIISALQRYCPTLGHGVSEEEGRLVRLPLGVMARVGHSLIPVQVANCVLANPDGSLIGEEVECPYRSGHLFSACDFSRRFVHRFPCCFTSSPF